MMMNKYPKLLIEIICQLERENILTKKSTGTLGFRFQILKSKNTFTLVLFDTFPKWNTKQAIYTCQSTFQYIILKMKELLNDKQLCGKTFWLFTDLERVKRVWPLEVILYDKTSTEQMLYSSESYFLGDKPKDISNIKESFFDGIENNLIKCCYWDKKDLVTGKKGIDYL